MQGLQHRLLYYAEACTDCRKTSFVDKKGVAGAEPPTGTRDGSPSKIPLSGGKGARGIGIVSQKFISKTDFFY